MVISQGEAIQKLVTLHEVPGRASGRENSRYSLCCFDGKAIPLMVLPPAQKYPKQTHWTWTDTNVRGGETPYLAYLPPLSENYILSAHQLPMQYDLTIVRPLDGPKIERSERRALGIMHQVAIPATFYEKLICQVNRIKAIRRTRHETRQLSEGQLVKRVLRRTTTDELRSWQIGSLLKILRMAEKAGDSILRLLNLYSVERCRQSLNRRQRLSDRCACKTANSSLSMRRSIADYFWTENELNTLVSNISARLDYCALARLIPAKSCHQIRNLLSRHKAKKLADRVSGLYSPPSITILPSWVSQTCCTCADECDPSNCPCRQRFHECTLTRAHYKCKNAYMGKGDGKQMADNVCIRPSPIAGWGCFACALLPEASFVMEYTGEVIRQEEAERRGFWCDLQKFSYFYELDDDFIVDATYTGTAMRFCNHSSKQANVQAEGKHLHYPSRKPNIWPSPIM